MSVECTFTIPTVYKWVRDQIPDPANPAQTIDDPLDLPPDEVIVKESCEAYAFTSYGTFLVTINGLGFDPVAGSQGNNSWSTSSGTLYTKRAGAETITLTCTPYALAVSDDFYAAASVYYRSSILTPHVALVGATRFYDPHAIKFLTGQQITASISYGSPSRAHWIRHRLPRTSGPWMAEAAA